MIGNSSREKILSRLYAASGGRESFQSPLPIVMKDFSGHKQEHLEFLLKDAGADVYIIDRRDLAETLKSVKAAHSLKTICHGTDIWYEDALRSAFMDAQDQLVLFARPLEEFRDTLFSVDASIVTALAAVAETGSLCLFPGVAEPRALSLVPPVLVVVLHAGAIFSDCRELFVSPLWKTSLSANPVFITGPSKSMAIEGSIIFGASGPQKLVVIIVC